MNNRCTSRHASKGILNYCAFHTILPTIQQAVEADPESATAKKLNALVTAQLQTYERLMLENGLSQENRDEAFRRMADYCGTVYQNKK